MKTWNIERLLRVGALWMSCSLACSANTQVVNGITWTYTVSNGVASVGYETDYSYSRAVLSSTTGAITIPTKLGGNTVTRIGSHAFYGCNGLTSVTIPDTVTSIGFYAFDGCSGLTSVIIPDSVTSIGGHAFKGCSGLTSVTIPDSVTSIGGSAFYNCSGLTSVTIPGSVTSIGSDTFYGCSSLTSVTIPDSVTSIGDYTFSGCAGLTSVTIPDSVTSIWSSAFSDCGGLYDTHSIPGVRLVDGWAIGVNGDTVLSETLDLTGVRGIGNSAFSGCNGLTSVTIPDSVTSIGDYTFSGCAGLTSVTIPDSVTSIGYETFYSCTNLMSVKIPGSVTSIGYNAFYGCSSLTSVNISDLAAWCGISFVGSFSNPLYYAHHLFLNGTDVTDLVIPDSVTDIGNSAFSGCSGLLSVTIPEGVTNIGSGAFYGCNGLLSVTIPEGVTNIGDDAFSNCANITSLSIHDSVTNIASGAFHGCVGLADGNGFVIVGNVLHDYIGTGGNVVIPDGVTSIYYGAFSGFTNLMAVTIPNSVTNIGSFYECSGLTSVTLPDGITEIGSQTFRRCSSLTSIEIPNGVTNIGDYAFANCSGLKSVTIPDSVTRIGYYAFGGCSSLPSVTVGCGVTEIGYGAFGNCAALRELYLPRRFEGRTSSMKIPDGCSIVFYDMISLDVFSPYGTATPEVGRHSFKTIDTTVKTCSVSAPNPENGVRHVCTGWTGTGSVPASGTKTNVSFVITGYSTLTWNWKAQNRLSISASGAGNCGFGAQWVDDGATATATLVPSCRFFNVALFGDADGVTIDGTSLSIPSDHPREIIVRIDETNPAAICDGPMSWQKGTSELGWSIVADTDAADGYVLRSDEVEAGEVAVIAATVQGAGRLEFNWRISANRGDYACLYIDGVETTNITRNTTWDQVSIPIGGSGRHLVRWEYQHRSVEAENENAAFLDNVFWNPFPLDEALDGAGLVWITDEGAEWTAQMTTTKDGVDAAMSCPVDENRVSGLETTITGPGTLSWYWKLYVRGVSGMDVFVDNDFGNPARTYEESGVWAVDSLAFDDDGTHTIRFEFWNLGTVESDCAYLDMVSWTLPATPLSVHRFYSKAYKGHFFTIDEEEKQNLIDTNPNWRYEGAAYRAYTNEATGTTALYRFYSKGYRGHFFTIDADEAESVKTNPNWKYEGVAYYVYPDAASDRVPVYRFWSKGYRHHFYTTDEAEKNNLIATNPNWKYEGVAFYALPADDTGRKANGVVRAAAAGVVAGAAGAGGEGVGEGVGEDEGERTGETGEAAAPWTLTLRHPCPGRVLAVPDVADLGDIVVETGDEMSACLAILATGANADVSATADAAELRLALPDGVFTAQLWDGVGTLLDEQEAEGCFDFALPASGDWHQFAIFDADGKEVFAIWLRAE